MCGIAGFGSMPIYMPKRGFHGFTDFHGKRRGLTCGPRSLSPRRAAVSALSSRARQRRRLPIDHRPPQPQGFISRRRASLASWTGRGAAGHRPASPSGRMCTSSGARTTATDGRRRPSLAATTSGRSICFHPDRRLNAPASGGSGRGAQPVMPSRQNPLRRRKFQS
jgi:hypothetical protein